MLSIEIAKKLKDAGLKWDPKLRDPFYYREDDDWEMDVLNKQDMQEATSEVDEYIADWVFAPRLDQTLAYMEEQGYKVESTQDTCYIFHPEKSSYWREFLAENRINAAAEALLYILEGRTTHE